MAKQRVGEWTYLVKPEERVIELGGGRTETTTVFPLFHTGIPTRDLTQDDVDNLDDEQYAMLEASALYEAKGERRAASASKKKSAPAKKASPAKKAAETMREQREEAIRAQKERDAAERTETAAHPDDEAPAA